MRFIFYLLTMYTIQTKEVLDILEREGVSYVFGCLPIRNGLFPLRMRPDFYPLLKRRIKNSWKKLFTDPLPEKTYLRGAAWLLKKEWLKEVDF